MLHCAGVKLPAQCNILFLETKKLDNNWFLAILHDMKPRPKVLKRQLLLAENLTKQHRGQLPGKWELIKLGYGGLYRYIMRHPDLFCRFEYSTKKSKQKILQ